MLYPPRLTCNDATVNESPNPQLLATYKNDNQTYFHFNDWLGNRRFLTNAAGDAPHTMTCTNYPFGDALSCTGSGVDATEHHFTGKERDTESGLDYFGARYYASPAGRWSSPDYSANSVILELPLSWNKYSYVLNRPLFAKDPDGRCPWCIGAAVGALAEGGFDLGKQLYNNGGDFSSVNYREVQANAVGGAVAGALAVATGGTSLVESAIVGDIVAGGFGNTVGGIVTRAAEGDTKNEVFSGSEISQDAVAGFIGGGVGHLAGSVVHVPDEPIRPDLRHQARTSVYQVRLAARNRAIVSQTVRAGVASSIGGQGTHSGFWFVDWLFSSPPPSNPHPGEEVTTTIYFDPNQNPLPQ